MKALVRSNGSVAVKQVNIVEPGEGEMRVRVRLAGLCRTDLDVARYHIGTKDPITLGHEFAGVVDVLDSNVTHLRPGDHVAVQPVFGCGTCEFCMLGSEINCLNRRMLGIDYDGAFAEYVTVPARLVHVIPAAVSWQAAAYAEPIAAALAVLEAGLDAHRPTLVLGDNRFAKLVVRLLRFHGFTQVVADHQPSNNDHTSRFDQVVETSLNSDTLARMVSAARPGGVLVLKSRRATSVSFDVLPLLLKQLTIRSVNYGSFARAVALLCNPQFVLNDLFGPIFSLDEFDKAVLADAAGETAKIFFDPAL